MHPIDSHFDWFPSATARGSLLILAVLPGQAAFRHRLPGVWRHALWKVAGPGLLLAGALTGAAWAQNKPVVDGGKHLIVTARARLADEEDAVRARLEKVIIPSIDLNEATLSDALAFLREKARELDPEKKGVNIVHVPAKGTLEPRLTVSFREIPLTEALKYFAALSGLEVDLGETAVVLRSASVTPVPAPNSGGAAAKVPMPVKPSGKSADLAARITLPHVDFKETSLPKVLQFLQQRSLELDPEKRGLNFVLNAPGDPAPESVRISLHLRELPLSEALRYVAELANLNLRYDEDAILFFRD